MSPVSFKVLCKYYRIYFFNLIITIYLKKAKSTHIAPSGTSRLDEKKVITGGTCFWLPIISLKDLFRIEQYLSTYFHVQHRPITRTRFH